MNSETSTQNDMDMDMNLDMDMDMDIPSSSSMNGDNRARLEYFTDGKNTKVDWPSHSVVIGRTQSGKSWLVAKILNNVDNIFERRTKSKIAVILSPYPVLEENLQQQIDEQYTCIYYSTPIFNEEFLDGVTAYLQESGLMGKELFLVLDDLMISSVGNNTSNQFFLKTFALIRHMNISIISTIQANSDGLLNILRNSTFIFCMQSFGIVNLLNKIIRQFIGLVNVPSLLRKIYPLLEERKKGSYILVNISFSADHNRSFTLSNDIFGKYGFTKKYLTKLSIENYTLFIFCVISSPLQNPI